MTSKYDGIAITFVQTCDGNIIVGIFISVDCVIYGVFEVGNDQHAATQTMCSLGCKFSYG